MGDVRTCRTCGAVLAAAKPRRALPGLPAPAGAGGGEPGRPEVTVTVGPTDPGRWRGSASRSAACRASCSATPIRNPALNRWSPPDRPRCRGPASGPAGSSSSARSPAAAWLLRHPHDARLNELLGDYLVEQSPEGRSEAIRYYSIARALRPSSGHELAYHLRRGGRFEEAEAILRELVAIRATPAVHAAYLGSLGDLLKQQGRSAEAAKVMEEAIASARSVLLVDAGEPEPHRHANQRRGAGPPGGLDHAGDPGPLRHADQRRGAGPPDGPDHAEDPGPRQHASQRRRSEGVSSGDAKGEDVAVNTIESTCHQGSRVACRASSPGLIQRTFC